MIDIEQIRAEFEAALIAEFTADMQHLAPETAVLIVRLGALGRDADGEYKMVVPRERFRGWVQARQALAIELPAPADVSKARRGRNTYLMGKNEGLQIATAALAAQGIRTVRAGAI